MFALNKVDLTTTLISLLLINSIYQPCVYMFSVTRIGVYKHFSVCIVVLFRMFLFYCEQLYMKNI